MAERRRRTGAIAVVLVVLVVLGAAAFLIWQQYTLSPQYAALKVVQAVSDRDWGAFSQWVDVPSVVRAGISAEASGTAAGGLLGRVPGAGDALVPVVERALQQRIEQGVPNVPPNVPFAVLLASGVVRGASIIGEDAYVTAETSYGGRPIRFDLRLRREAGRWRVVEVRNARQLLGAGS